MSDPANTRPGLAIYLVLRNEGKIAFVFREHAGWMDQYYSLLAGRAENGETVTQGVIREALEEGGITVSANVLQHILTVHRHDIDSDWLDVYFEATSWEGELTNSEPEKHGHVAWLPADDLPDNIIPPQRAALEAIARGETYAEYGWENS